MSQALPCAFTTAFTTAATLAGAAAFARAAPAVAAGRTGAAADTIRTGRIVVNGNTRTRTRVILRRIPLRPGDPFDYKRLEQARANLRSIPGIDYSEIRVQYQREDSSLGLSVFVTEVPTLAGSIWLQRGSEDEFSIGAALRDPNFRGNGERLRVSGVFLNDTAVRVRWENPWLGNGHKRVGIGVTSWYRSYRYAYDDFSGIFDRVRIRREGVRALVFHESMLPAPRPWERPGSLKPRLRMTAFAGIERIESGVIGPPNGSGANTEIETGLSLVHDTRTSAAFPFAGRYLSARLAWVTSLDGVRPVREARVDARLFVPIGGRLVSAARIGATLRGGSEFAYRREHVGGGTSLRGWSYGSFHGYSAAIGTAELRLPLNFTRDEPLEAVLLGIEVHAFADGAATWDRYSTLSNKNVFAGYGAGISLLNRQMRGLRVDWGFTRQHKNRVHVEVGTSF